MTEEEARQQTLLYRSALDALWGPGQPAYTMGADVDVVIRDDPNRGLRGHRIYDLRAFESAPWDAPSLITWAPPQWWVQEGQPAHVLGAPGYVTTKGENRDRARVKGNFLPPDQNPWLVVECDYGLLPHKDRDTKEYYNVLRTSGWTEEQLGRFQVECYAWALQAAGFPFTALVDSGSKSMHAIIRLSQPCPYRDPGHPEHWRWLLLREKLYLALPHGFDASVYDKVGAERWSRCPGALRRDKSHLPVQSIRAVGQQRTFEELEAWATGQLSDTCRRWLDNANRQGGISRKPAQLAALPWKPGPGWREAIFTPVQQGMNSTNNLHLMLKDLACSGCRPPRCIQMPCHAPPWGQWDAPFGWWLTAFAHDHFQTLLGPPHAPCIFKQDPRAQPDNRVKWPEEGEIQEKVEVNALYRNSGLNYDQAESAVQQRRWNTDPSQQPAPEYFDVTPWLFELEAFTRDGEGVRRPSRDAYTATWVDRQTGEERSATLPSLADRETLAPVPLENQRTGAHAPLSATSLQSFMPPGQQDDGQGGFQIKDYLGGVCEKLTGRRDFSRIRFQGPAFADENLPWFIFERGCWRQYSKLWVEKLINESMEEQWLLAHPNAQQQHIFKDNHRAEVYKALRVKAAYDRLWEERPDAVAFRNGTVYIDASTGDHEFVPDHFEHDNLRDLTELDWSDEDMHCPRFQWYLENMQPDPRERNTMIKFMALGLLPNRRVKCFMALRGEGDGGKSGYIAMGEYIFGPERSLGADLSVFTGSDVHGTECLPGKRWVSVTEVEVRKDKARELTSMVKRITGGDPVSINPKWSKRYSAKIPCQILFTGNELPAFMDDSNALWKRMVPITIPKIPEDRQVDADRIKQDILAELPQIYRLLMHHLKQVLAKNSSDPRVALEVTDTVLHERKEVQENSDPLLMFIAEYCEPSSDDAHYIHDQAFFTAYSMWRKVNGYSAVNKSTFRSHLQQVYRNRQLEGSGYSLFEYRRFPVGASDFQLSGVPDGFVMSDTSRPWCLRGIHCKHRQMEAYTNVASSDLPAVRPGEGVYDPNLPMDQRGTLQDHSPIPFPSAQ